MPGPGLNKDKRKLVLDLVEDQCRTYMGDEEGKFYKLDDLTDEDKGEISHLGIEK